MHPRTPQEELLVSGLQDWTYASWALEMVRPPEEIAAGTLRDLTLTLIRDLLTAGLVVAGDIDRKGRHVPWKMNATEAADRIAREWIQDWGDEIPTPGAVVWLDNTAAGDEVAHGVLARAAHG